MKEPPAKESATFLIDSLAKTINSLTFFKLNKSASNKLGVLKASIQDSKAPIYFLNSSVSAQGSLKVFGSNYNKASKDKFPSHFTRQIAASNTMTESKVFFIA